MRDTADGGRNLVVDMDREQYSRLQDFAAAWHRRRGEGQDLTNEEDPQQ